MGTAGFASDRLASLGGKMYKTLYKRFDALGVCKACQDIINASKDPQMLYEEVAQKGMTVEEIKQLMNTDLIPPTSELLEELNQVFEQAYDRTIEEYSAINTDHIAAQVLGSELITEYTVNVATLKFGLRTFQSIQNTIKQLTPIDFKSLYLAEGEIKSADWEWIRNTEFNLLPASKADNPASKEKDGATQGEAPKSSFAPRQLDWH